MDRQAPIRWEESSIPREMFWDSDSASIRISADGANTCVLTILHGIRCWGGNKQGELGNGTSERQSLPVTVTGLTMGVLEVAAGWNQTCAIMTGGRVKCWGGNIFGQLGDGTTVSHTIPTEVIGLAGRVVLVDVGWAHMCAITEDGGLVCWGNNSYGQLGDGTNTDSPVPLLVDKIELEIPTPTSTTMSVESITPTGEQVIPNTPTETGTPGIYATPTITRTKTPMGGTGC